MALPVFPLFLCGPPPKEKKIDQVKQQRAQKKTKMEYFVPEPSSLITSRPSFSSAGLRCAAKSPVVVQVRHSWRRRATRWVAPCLCFKKNWRGIDHTFPILSIPRARTSGRGSGWGCRAAPSMCLAHCHAPSCVAISLMSPLQAGSFSTSCLDAITFDDEVFGYWQYEVTFSESLLNYLVQMSSMAGFGFSE